MQQGLLFEPEVMARTELQDAIARLDFHVPNFWKAAESLNRVHWGCHSRLRYYTIDTGAKMS